MTASSLSASSARVGAPAARSFRWSSLLWTALLALSLAAILWSDFAHLAWVSELSMQGTPAPAIDPKSPTGYELGQRHFLGAQERGETYRWIAAAQEFHARGFFASVNYDADSVPTGRPLLLPRLYAAWICSVAWGLHLFTGNPLPLSIERAALWEPLISHLLALAAATWFLGRRHGLSGAAVAALLFAFFPPLAGQFLPGVLTARTWSLLLAAGAIAASLPHPTNPSRSHLLSVGSALAAGAALWLDPAFGFPAVLISATVAFVAILAEKSVVHALRWSVAGAALTLVACLIDRSPWSPAAGELRYVHPLYALAWLGLGLALDAALHLRVPLGAHRKLRLLELTAAVLLVGTLAYVQLSHAFKGWFYPSVWIRRLVSLDQSVAVDHVFGWMARASLGEVLFVSVPLFAASLLLVSGKLRERQVSSSPRAPLWPTLALWIFVLLFAIFRLRWAVVAVLVATPLFWTLAARQAGLWRQSLRFVGVSFLLGCIVWNLALPASLQRPSLGREPSASDLEALVNRHFARWLVTHSPPQQIVALAPPELADSLAFHAGARVLMSTAWESYPGQVAATRILSAPEATEAQAVIEAHGLTHLILPSWDKVLPLFVRKPAGETREPIYERLQHWLHPSYLRPLPYRLPPLPAFASAQLAVFKVSAPEDEALWLSRLTEYFVEMERPEPAALAARALAESFPDDPNAAIARATFYAATKRNADLDRELDRLAGDIAADRVPFLWDRRVQRAIVLALGRRSQLARPEVEACLASASLETVYELTPLQAFRLEALAKAFRLTPEPEFAKILATLSAELSAAAPTR